MAVSLERPLPTALPAGSRSSVFVLGRAPGARRVQVGVGAAGALAIGPPGDVFWATVDVVADGRRLPVTVATDSAAPVTLGSIDVTPARTPAPAGGSTIAVCLATHEPDPALLRVQLDSLRAQSDADWTCVVVDDASSPTGRDAIVAAVDGDDRFTVCHRPHRAGFYRTFETALELAPPSAGLVALCDHDDRWHPDKLATLRAAMAGGATLAYSDQRLTTPAGAVLHESMWRSGRTNDTSSVLSALVANSVTGAAAMIRRDVVERALPFPDPPGIAFHDAWLALVALTAGSVAYVDRPLYDYVQHRGAVFGDVATGGAAPPRASRRDRLAGACLYGYEARAVLARTALARCADVVTPAKRAELEGFLAAADRPVALARLAARPTMRAMHGRSETLGAERGLAAGLLWRAWVRHAERLPRRLRPRTEPPGLLAFEQPRLRAWRASLGAR